MISALDTWVDGHKAPEQIVASKMKDGKVERAEIRSLLGKPCRVRFGQVVKEFKTGVGKVYALRGEKLS